MNFFKIILFMFFILPLMLLLSGCFNDAILDAIKAEEDFIAPFDVVLRNEQPKRTTYFPITATGSEIKVVDVDGDDASRRHLDRPIQLESKDNYNVNGHHVVIDSVTGLMWTKCTAINSKEMDTDPECGGSEITGLLSDAPQLIEWYKASQLCKDLEYAGHKDWRLPRLPELLTIVNYGYHPAIDPKVFPNNRGGDVEVLKYTKRYKLDDRPRFIKGSNGDYTQVENNEDSYTTARYIREDGKYVFNEGFKDKYIKADDGTHVLVYLDFIELKDELKILEELEDGTYKVTIEGVPYICTPSDRYNYDPVWGFGYFQNDEGKYLRIFIKKNDEDTFDRSGVDYVKLAGPYVREYVPDVKVSWEWSDFWGVYVSVQAPYEAPRVKYKFNGTNFISDENGAFIQKFDKPYGYWTYSSKLFFDENINIKDYGWSVFFQGGGSFGVNISSPVMKIKEDLTFEKQFVRCVRGGKGDIDDVDY